jgi:hypothetical protein
MGASTFQNPDGSHGTAPAVKCSEFQSTDTEAWVRFPALPDFLRSIGSGVWSSESKRTLSLMSTIEELLER